MVILYAAGPAVTAQCRAVAKGGQLTLIEVKHLQAACATLKTAPAAMLVLSPTVKWWDRAVVEEHAARAAVSTTLAAEEDVAEIGQTILTWVAAAARPRLPGGPSRSRRS